MKVSHHKPTHRSRMEVFCYKCSSDVEINSLFAITLVTVAKEKKKYLKIIPGVCEGHV